jgi:hypothetical protein
MHTQLLDVRTIYEPSLDVLGDVLFVYQGGDDVNNEEIGAERITPNSRKTFQTLLRKNN